MQNLFKVTNRDTTTTSLSLILTLNIIQTFFWFFYGWLWACMFLLGFEIFCKIHRKHLWWSLFNEKNSIAGVFLVTFTNFSERFFKKKSSNELLLSTSSKSTYWCWSIYKDIFAFCQWSSITFSFNFSKNNISPKLVSTEYFNRNK